MADFLTGASWGAWFVLAAITAAVLWAIVLVRTKPRVRRAN